MPLYDHQPTPKRTLDFGDARDVEEEYDEEEYDEEFYEEVEEYEDEEVEEEEYEEQQVVEKPSKKFPATPYPSKAVAKSKETISESTEGDSATPTVIVLVLLGLTLMFLSSSFLSDVIAPAQGGDSKAIFDEYAKGQEKTFQHYVSTEIQKYLDEHYGSALTENQYNIVRDSVIEKVQTELFPKAQKEYLSTLMNEHLEGHLRDEIATKVVSLTSQAQKELSAEIKKGMSEINQKTDDVAKKISDINQELDALKEMADIGFDEEATMKVVRETVDHKLAIYHADQTNKIDWALFSSGARVQAHSVTEQVLVTPPVIQLGFLFEESAPAKPPKTMLMGNMRTGECWPMKGSDGFAVVELRQAVVVQSFSIEHPDASITPTPLSMPKTVQLFGVKNTASPRLKSQRPADADLVHLGQLDYDSYDPHRIQEAFFENTESFQYVMMQVDANYGANYTCIYRLRVHGVLQD